MNLIKPTSVGIASFVLLKEFRNFSPKAPAIMAISASSIMLLSEKIRASRRNWRDNRTNWLEHKENTQKKNQPLQEKINLAFFSLLLIYPFCKNPQEHLTSRIAAMDIKTISHVIIIAPIVEEIFFRGFLQETFETSCELISRHVYPIPYLIQKRISSIAQAIIFGAIHCQSEHLADNLLVFTATWLLGLKFSLYKENYNGGLIKPIRGHMLHNSLAVLKTIACAFAGFPPSR